MAVLTPSIPPPASSMLSTKTIPVAGTSSMPETRDRIQGKATEHRTDVELEEESPPVLSKIPTARIDAAVPVISDLIASRLASTLLRHALFLKGQVPLPVIMLHKQRLTNPKADKPRLELLNTLDILSSHLDTTFTALSTSYALSKTPSASEPGSGSSNDTTGRPTYLAILMGPNITTARAKIILGVDSLEERIWGLRDDQHVEEAQNEEECEDDDEDDDEDEEEDDEEEDDVEEEDSDAEGPEDSESEPEEEEEENDDDDEDENSEDSLRPEHTARSASNNPTLHVSPPELEQSIPHVRVEDPQQPPPQQQPQQRPRPHQPQAPVQTYADLQTSLLKADRLFSNTLARAEGEGRGMGGNELAPTRTHILLRAPRRFKHPAWVPRQNVQRTMDRVVQEFEEALVPSVDNSRANKKASSKVEGVWVTAASQQSTPVVSSGETVTGEEDEQDEMIWWSWEREIVGYNQ